MTPLEIYFLIGFVIAGLGLLACVFLDDGREPSLATLFAVIVFWPFVLAGAVLGGLRK